MACANYTQVARSALAAVVLHCSLHDIGQQLGQFVCMYVLKMTARSPHRDTGRAHVSKGKAWPPPLHTTADDGHATQLASEVHACVLMACIKRGVHQQEVSMPVMLPCSERPLITTRQRNNQNPMLEGFTNSATSVAMYQKGRQTWSPAVQFQDAEANTQVQIYDWSVRLD